MNISRKTGLCVGGQILLNLTVQSQERPNILWLTYEDTSPQFVGCYGNPDAKTPNIDRLAENGVRFTAAFAVAPVSSASRFCLFTGVRPTTMGTGNHRSGYNVPEYIKGFPEYIRNAGYYTSNNEKTDYNLPNVDYYIRNAWDECSNKADWRGRAKGQPFFAVYNSMSSHQSRTMTMPREEYDSLVIRNLAPDEITRGGKLEMPEIYKNSHEMQYHLERVYNSITLMDRELGKWLKKIGDDGLNDNTIIFCFSDHGEGIPRGKQSSLGLGYRVPFVLYFPEKYAHLFPFKKGEVSEQLISFEDIVATVLSLCDVKIPSYMEGKAFAGKQRSKVRRKYVYSALDRTDENTDLCRSITDGKYLYTRVFTPYQPFLRWMTYTDVSDIQKQIRSDFKNKLLNDIQNSILEPRLPEYLYDIQNDTWESRNLINESSYLEITNRLKAALKKEILKQKDAHFIPEYSFIEKKNQISPCSLRLDHDFFPVQEVINTAWMSGLGEEVLEKQIKALDHSNPLVQYWAAVGLLCQKTSLKKHESKLNKILEHAQYPPLRVYLSAILYSNCGNIQAKEEYIKLLNNSNPEVARMALQILFYTDEQNQKTFLPIVKQLLAECKGNDDINKMKQCKLFIAKWEGTPKKF